MKLLFTSLFALVSCSGAFAPTGSVDLARHGISSKSMHSLRHDSSKIHRLLSQDPFESENNLHVPEKSFEKAVFSSFMAMTSLLFPTVVNAADVSDGNYQILSAIAAYVHYLSLFVMVGSLTFERFTVEPGMSVEKEKALGIADALYGVAGFTLLISGYYRAVAFGKGWDFYSHEPIFWLKMIFLSILGAASLFPTITIIKRTIAIQNGKELEPMTEKLAKRLKSVANAELVMLASIPLAATSMARGVLYTEDIPFNIIGPILVAITAGGLGYKYVKEALSWTEE